METVLTGNKCEVKFGLDLPTIIIAERINPTGRKALAQQLKEGKLDMVKEDAKQQTEAGAEVIDINVGAVGVDEVELLPKAVKAVMEVTDQPICIDSSDPKALKAALEVCPYKLLINSVTGEEKSMEEILPVVKESGSAVVCLTCDEKGIPKGCGNQIQYSKTDTKKGRIIKDTQGKPGF
ncbi:MAG: dihydropteroate synthase [Actinomycetota bacterium]|nr:dihydropteroate synthase [Actinomycetota bacterium]